MWRIVAMVLAFALVGACTATVEPPKAKVVIPAISVEPQQDGTFCPPGQGKKGRC
jgi:hypothetical protein